MRYKDIIFPRKLWTSDFTYWWVISLCTVFLFDIFWMMQTTFRPMSMFAFYPVLFLSAFFLSFPSLFAKKGVVQTLWLLFFDALFIANLMYCRTYYNAIPLHSYALIGNLADFKSSVTDSFKWYFIFLPILTIGAFVILKISFKKTNRAPSLFIYALYIIFLGVITWAADAWRGGTLKRMDMMANYAYLSSSITPVYSLAGYWLHDYYKTSEKLTPDEEKEVREWLNYHEDFIASENKDSVLSAAGNRRNLIIILCESLESWVIEQQVEGKEITPYLNSLLSDSTTFYAPHVLTQVGSGRSIDGQLLILTGLMPMENRAYAYEAIENNYFTLPKAMKERGAKTVLFTCDKPYVWNQVLVNKAFGIDSLVYSKDFEIDETAGPSRRLTDGSFMRQITQKLEKGDIWKEGEPVFLLAVTYSGHNPFKLPEHLRKIEFKGVYPEIITNYMTTANYTDSALKILIDYLKSREDWDQTMVVITGDHEGLATDRKEAIANRESSGFVDHSQHTPLIILNSPIGGRYEAEMGQADIYSTILDLMKMKDYPWSGLGISAFSPEAPGFAFGSVLNLDGDTVGKPHDMIKHIRDARHISDLILKFDLLKNYPDSI